MNATKDLLKLDLYSQEYKKFLTKLLELTKIDTESVPSTSESLANSLEEVAPLLSQRFKLGAIIRSAYHMLTTSDHKVVFDYLFNELQTVIPYDRLSVALIKDDKIEGHWIRSKHPIQFLKVNHSASVKEGSLATVIRTGTPRIISDLRDYYKHNPTSLSTELALKEGILSSLTFPLMTSTGTVGVIFFSSYSSHIYTEDHIRIFQEIAEDFAVILDQDKIKMNTGDLNKDKMLSMVVHDLRAPVGVMMGFLDLLLEESWFEKLSDKDKKIFSILKRNSEGMLGLINELSDMRKISNEHLELQSQKVFFREYMNELFMRATMLGQQKNIQLEYKFSEMIPDYIFFDPKRIRQVIDNLISNAIKFSYPGTTVTINIYTEGEKLYFSVNDQGAGIPTAEQGKLFTEFGKTSVRPTAGEYSTGLGLAIVKRIVNACGGSIIVHSEVGKGSEFVFWIPLKIEH